MEIIKFLQSFRTPFLDEFFQAITFMGEDMFFILVITLIFWCVNKEFALKLGFACLTSSILNGALKEVFQVPRPIGQPGIFSLRLETATGYSFPSGHTQLAACLWGTLALKIKKEWMYGVALILTLLVAISRLYLGVHWPADVLAGMGIGASWVWISNSAFDSLKNSIKKKEILLFFIVPVVAGCIFFREAGYFKAAGGISGFLAGYLAESKYIRFSVKAPIGQQVIKYVIGLTGLFLLKTGLKVLLPELLVSDLLRYFVLGLWATAVAPFLFTRILPQPHPHKQGKNTAN